MPPLPVFHRRRDGLGSMLDGAPFLSVLEPNHTPTRADNIGTEAREQAALSGGSA
jgi:hypothetical protein